MDNFDRENLTGSSPESRYLPGVPWTERAREDRLEWIAKGFQRSNGDRAQNIGYFDKDLIPTEDNRKKAEAELEKYDLRVKDYLLEPYSSGEFFSIQHEHYNPLMCLGNPAGAYERSFNLQEVYFLLGIPEIELYKVLEPKEEFKKDPFLAIKMGGEQLTANTLRRELHFYKKEDHGYLDLLTIIPREESSDKTRYKQTKEGDFIVTEKVNASDTEENS